MGSADRIGPAAMGGPSRAFPTVVLIVSGLVMLAGGGWAELAPRSFAAFTGFAYHPHFVHDAGASSVGIGVTLLLAAVWADVVAVVLAGFLAGNSLHAVNHAIDLEAGGHGWDPWVLATGSLVVLAALLARMRGLGWVAGEVATTVTSAALAPFVRQKTILLTSFRRDGRPVGAPVSVVVDGDRAYVRSPGEGGKIKRIRNNPVVEIAPCTGSGRATGPAVRMSARLLDGAEFRHAGRLLARKYPMLHGVLVPLAHRLGRARFGRTAHLALTPLGDRPATGEPPAHPGTESRPAR
ncbi:PPOX class F420-dependent oxidoreductase [Nonomuraea rubra]